MDARTWMALGAAFYGLALVLAVFGLFDPRRRRGLRTLQFAIILGAFLLQTIGLHLRGLQVESCPIGNPFEVLQFISWSILLIFIVTGTVFRLSLLGSFSALMAGLLSLVSFFVPAWDRAYPAGGLFGGNPWTEGHAAIGLLSYGFFGMLAVTSAMYLLQHFGLKTKRNRGLFAALPSIRELDLVSHRLLLIGTLTYTLSILIGSVAWIGDGNLSSPKLIATVLLWVAYVGLFLAKWRHLLHGTRAAWAGLFLFAAALFVLWPVEADRSEKPAPASLPQ